MSAKHISYFSWLSDLFYSLQTSKFILKLCQCNENYQALIALAFAHFSSELLLKEQMIIPVKKTLHNAGHIDAKLISFSEICQKNCSEIGCFLLIVSWRSFPPKFPMKSADFSKNLPLKILRNLIFLQILTFLSRNRPIFLLPANLPLKILRNFAFFLRNIRSPEITLVSLVSPKSLDLNSHM